MAAPIISLSHTQTALSPFAVDYRIFSIFAQNSALINTALLTEQNCDVAVWSNIRNVRKIHQVCGVTLESKNSDWNKYDQTQLGWTGKAWYLKLHKRKKATQTHSRESDQL